MFDNVEKPYVVNSATDALKLANYLADYRGPLGLDVETIGCNPKKQSPVHKAVVVCWSLAWFPPGGPCHPRTKTPLAARAFVWASLLDYFRTILTSSDYPKILQGGTWDLHALMNAGYTVNGYCADTKHLSRFWYSSKDVAHDLKSQMAAILGYKADSYEALFSKPAKNKPKVYKRSGYVKIKKGPLANVPTWVEAGEHATFSWRERELIPLDRVAEDYPQRVATLEEYASLDAKGTLELYPYRQKQLAGRKAKGTQTSLDIYNQYWQPMLCQLIEMERRGMYVSADECGQVRSSLMSQAEEPAKVLADWSSKTKWSSPAQMQELFFHELDLPRPPIKGTLKAVKRAKSDEYSTSEASLLWLESNCPKYQVEFAALRKWRKLTKAAQYVRDLPGYIATDGRVHTVLGPEADTGRLSSKNPALHQIPSDASFGIRRVFQAAPGKVLIVADMSQLEIYIMAHMLIKLFKDYSLANALQTGDVYTWIARECWPELKELTDAQVKVHEKRKLAKIIVLATNYLKTPMGLALTLLDEMGRPATEQHAQALYDLYYSRLPGITIWHEWTAEYAAKYGGIHTILGRWRPIPDALSDISWLAARGARQAANTPIQGSAKDVMTCAMLGLQHLPLLLEVHDELILEVDEDKAEETKAEVVRVMENPPGVELMLPLKVEAKVAKTWAEGK